jgi:UPF0271 protein
VARSFGAGLVGQPGFEILKAAERAGIPAYREGYADRRLLPDGHLAPRHEPGSVLEPEAAVAQAVAMASSGTYDTICIHGDSPGAARVAAAVLEAFKAAGIATAHLSTRA